MVALFFISWAPFHVQRLAYHYHHNFNIQWCVIQTVRGFVSVLVQLKFAGIGHSTNTWCTCLAASTSSPPPWTRSSTTSWAASTGRPSGPSSSARPSKAQRWTPKSICHVLYLLCYRQSLWWARVGSNSRWRTSLNGKLSEEKKKRPPSPPRYNKICHLIIGLWGGVIRCQKGDSDCEICIIFRCWFWPSVLCLIVCVLVTLMLN